MDRETLRRLFALCSDEPLDPRDQRNVDFDHLAGLAVRGVSWVDRLASSVLLSTQPTRQLISGLPGSGKSTELRRLDAYLLKEGYLVARVDAEDAFDLTQPIDVPDLIAVLVATAERRVLELEGAKLPEGSGYLARLWQWLTHAEVELKELEISGGPVNLALEMKVRPAFRQQVRASMARQFPRFLKDAYKELKSLDGRVQAKGMNGLCLVLDSLEKLRGLASNWIDVLESAERVFSNGAANLNLPVHSILTVPPALMNRLNAHVEFMPMVKLRERSGKRFKPGFAAFRELARKRIADSDLEGLLGPAFEKRLESVIERTGGYPRELVAALRWMVQLPAHPAKATDLARLVNENRERLRMLITDQDVPWLARVSVSKTLPMPTDADRPMVDRAIQNNIVLRYLNEDAWFDLHPAALDIPAVKQAIAELSAGNRG